MVYLVGAGPGDAELVTLKAVKCLNKADAVVYDHLADKRILKHAKADTQFVYVGKIAGNHTMRQEEINALLISLAKEGREVVRLKGGDPFVFGRGGEEALALAANDLPFEIVPGVTSAVAVPAYAGIPVTHRGMAASFAVITGHEDPAKGSTDIRWDELATATDTLIFLMGIKNLPQITANLIANGKPKDTPAAIIRYGTLNSQQTTVTTLGEAANIKTSPPGIFIVGPTVTLREKLRRFDDVNLRPLFGKKILVTRTRAQASALVDKLDALGAICVEQPTIKIATPSDDYRKIDDAIKTIDKFNRIILTSANGVDSFFARLKHARKDARALHGAQIVVIGSATAERLERYGIMADAVPKRFCAEGIVDLIGDEIVAGERILIARAEQARELLTEELTARGAVVTVAPVYRTLVADDMDESIIAQLKNGEFDCVTFTSSSTVMNFVHLMGDANYLQSVKTACIGKITANTLKSFGVDADIVAHEYTINGLVQAIKDSL